MKFSTSPKVVRNRIRHGLAVASACLVLSGFAMGVSQFTPYPIIGYSLAADALSPETQNLFTAIRDGDIGSAQNAVVEGADLSAKDADNLTPAELAESLNRYTIARFLRAYEIIEGGTLPTNETSSQEEVAAAKEQPITLEVPEDAFLSSPETTNTAESNALTKQEVAQSAPSASSLDPINLGDGAENEDFFAEMKVFGGEPADVNAQTSSVTDPQSTPTEPEAHPTISDAPAGNAISSLGGTALIASPSSPLGRAIPEHEKLRNAVLLKLRKESEDRLTSLEDERKKMINEVLAEEQAEIQATGVDNIQSEFRAKKRAELSGSELPPGYVAPPDGGNSAVRFLQRLGLFGDDDEAEQQRIVAESLPHETQQALKNVKTKTFTDSGYSAPPAGQTITSSGDSAVSVISQMTQMFKPATGSPRTGSLVEGLSGGFGSTNNQQQMAQLPASSQSTGISQGVIQSGRQTQQGTEIAAQPSQPAIAPYPLTDETWDVTASMGGLSGSMVETQPEPEIADNPIIDTLANVFVPQQDDGSDSSALASFESSGSWDVVSVKVAPAAAQMLLGLPTDGRLGVLQLGTPIMRPAATPATGLVMGQSVMLGKSPPTALDPSAAGKSCITKHQGTVTFCIESIDWPESLQTAIWVDTVMYQGLNAIVRYDNGVATRYHSLFPSESFSSIVEHYIAKLGPPHNTWNRSISPLAAEQQANPTVSWKAVNPYTQVVNVLEIRQFDDTRGGFPDDKRGAIMLHNAQSGTIFPQVSAFELMRLRPVKG